MSLVGYHIGRVSACGPTGVPRPVLDPDQAHNRMDGAQCAPPLFRLVTPMAFTVRIWDLPTRLFHWTLALTTVAQRASSLRT